MLFTIERMAEEQLLSAILTYCWPVGNRELARLSSDFGMSDFGKFVLFFGIVLVIIGLALIVLGRTNLPIGRLPGDIVYRGKNTTFYFPLATCILLSVVLSLVLYVISRFRR